MAHHHQHGLPRLDMDITMGDNVALERWKQLDLQRVQVSGIGCCAVNVECFTSLSFFYGVDFLLWMMLVSIDGLLAICLSLWVK